MLKIFLSLLLELSFMTMNAQIVPIPPRPTLPRTDTIVWPQPRILHTSKLQSFKVVYCKYTNLWAISCGTGIEEGRFGAFAEQGNVKLFMGIDRINSTHVMIYSTFGRGHEATFKTKEDANNLLTAYKKSWQAVRDYLDSAIQWDKIYGRQQEINDSLTHTYQ